MNALAVIVVITFGLTALASANVDYKLRCTRQEVGVRWPSYSSNSEYYVCDGVGGNQLTINCSPGEVFIYVLQLCSSPSKFIPPPPLDILPISKFSTTSMNVNAMPTPIEVANSVQKPMLPQPLYPSSNVGLIPHKEVLHPPVISSDNTHIVTIKEQTPVTSWEQNVPLTLHQPNVDDLTSEKKIPIENIENSNTLNENVVGIPPMQSGNNEVPTPATPPTPAPTPKVAPKKKVQPSTPSSSKKVNNASAKKPTPGSSKKTPSTTKTNSKQSSKKQSALPDVKSKAKKNIPTTASSKSKE